MSFKHEKQPSQERGVGVRCWHAPETPWGEGRWLCSLLKTELSRLSERAHLKNKVEPVGWLCGLRGSADPSQSWNSNKVEGENPLHKVALWSPHVHHVVCAHTQTINDKVGQVCWQTSLLPAGRGAWISVSSRPSSPRRDEMGPKKWQAC